ncbi:BadF/BadG/BcrA/BcrD ATPase family protein [Nonomuraea sp. NPDC050680]|uniref:BadF/BadG/BcrA/BcrD ATPase family protein n=1 Tax=Nonomuraea sp. NPDC050680 TaxID=3154630 RepID=UPI0033CD027F
MDVAIDGGQTGLRLGLAVAGRIREVREVPGLSYAEGSPVEAVLARIETAWGETDQIGTASSEADQIGAGLSEADQIGAGLSEADRIAVGLGEVDTICLGLTTILDDPDKLAVRLLTMARRVLITTDVVTSHAGAFSGGPGVVLAAGTGAIALGVGVGAGMGAGAGAGVGAGAGAGAGVGVGVGAGDGGEIRQADGWGYLFGDAGSGFWIGRRGLDAAYRGFDGRSAPGPLTDRARAVFGDLAELPAKLYLAPDAVAQVARFAVHVLELTEDPTARAIVEEAGRELASTVTAAARCFPAGATVPVAWTGRLLRDPVLRAGFEAELARRLPQARLRPPTGDSLAGAALLAAADDLGRYDTMIRTVRR